MRIMAGRAPDSTIRSIVAFTVTQAIRLEAHILNSARAAGRNLRPCAMTLTAEVRHLLSSERCEVAHFPGPDAWVVGAMASLALHSFDHRREYRARRFHYIGGMATEALAHFRRSSQTA